MHDSGKLNEYMQLFLIYLYGLGHYIDSLYFEVFF